MLRRLLLGALALGILTLASSGVLTDHPVWTEMHGGSHGAPGGLGTPYTEVRAMAAATPADIWAVGVNRGPSGEQGRIQHWDGVQWTVNPMAKTGAQRDVFNGVAVLSSTDAWAVGYSAGIHDLQEATLVQHWDGRSWNLVPSPNPTRTWNELDGIVALSPVDAWAVGYAKDDFAGAVALVEHWNGSSWTVVGAPSPGKYWNQLSAVAARSPHDIWAAGWQQGDGPRSALLEHYDGATWSLVAVEGHDLHAMAAAVGVIWAVGGSGIHLARDGWLQDAMPVGPSEGAYVWSAAASGPSDAWMVGSITGRGGEQALLEHWDGASWKPVSLPASPPATRLTGVLSLSSRDVWVAGTRQETQPRTLIEHWDGLEWSTVNAPD